MQSVGTAFANIATSTLQWPAAAIRIAWTRISNSLASFAEIDGSTIDGDDIIQGEFTAITPSDLFQYFNEDDRLLNLRLERFVKEPIGGLSYAKLSAKLENTDQRFTPGSNSTIGTAIIPKRPIKIALGFTINNLVKALPQFEGLISKTPNENKTDASVTIDAFDYLSYLDEFQLSSSMYINQTSDQIVLDILQAAGFNSLQYNLDTGLNTIGYVWFEKGTTAGYAIRKICEAEEAHFYQDEFGQLRFENRRKYIESPYTNVQHTIHGSDIIRWENDDNTPIINRCNVIANPREVGARAVVWEKPDVELIKAGESLTRFAEFENPVVTLTDPVETTDYTANTAEDGSGSDETSNLSIVATNLTTNVKLVFTNNAAYDIYITFVQLRGTPATLKYQEGIKETYQDDDSINKYGEVKELTIRNDFIDSQSFAYYLARAIVRKYKNDIRRIKVTIAVVPQLQLKDKITVEDPYLGTTLNYRIMGIILQRNGPSFLQTLTLREITSVESDGPAKIDSSTIDGVDVLWT